ncbi:MAG: DegT/DnrJ/EryC1/StrS family aminotransferase [Flavobacteriales bacterium]|nr:DegT/DnrJ/EryC1/StrS family aminotransferase [Flavobacteriales bacterium]MDW8432714.1 DegT/DnrJ/EryC1/StrS family aminotransferase [Flavobacteriales bacterium]
MVDLRGQYEKIKEEVLQGIQKVIEDTAFIQGPDVQAFAEELATWNEVRYVIPCANGTDALQIALMALDLQPGDEVIVPAFTYVATAEVIGLLRLVPVLVPVDPDTFNLDVAYLEAALSPKTKAIVPVHLFGQSAYMEPILDFAKKHGLFVVEDNAQAIGAQYRFADGRCFKTGAMGHIGCTSFFPSKNLGCYGDGGALMTNDPQLAEKIKMIANHGQQKKYYHEILGVNSRLDTVQAAVLRVKLRHLDTYCAQRQAAAARYDAYLSGCADVQLPVRAPYSTHVFHQYTLKISGGRRDALKNFLQERGIPTMVYYPVPLQNQNAFREICKTPTSLEVCNKLCQEVLSLPMHTELSQEQQEFISDNIFSFFKK